jgi:hypothetical protein
MNGWHLYCYFRPFAPIEPCYIGIGTKQRWSTHLRFAKGGRAASGHSCPKLIKYIRMRRCLSWVIRVG